MAPDYTLDDYRRQLDQALKLDMKHLVGRRPDPSEEELALAVRSLHQMIDAMTDEERQVLIRLPRMTAAMTGEERLTLQLLWQRVLHRQMIDAMTDEERSNPDLIDSSRRTRIASACGTDSKEVEKLLAGFHKLRQIMRDVRSWSRWRLYKMAFGHLWNQGLYRVITLMLIVVLVYVAIVGVLVVLWRLQ
jgi:signal recognition particle GTPase